MAKWFSIGRGWIGPELSNAGKGWGQTFLVRAARLGEDASDPFGMLTCYQQADGSTKIKEVDGEILEADDLRELVDRVGYVDESVLVLIRSGAGGVAESWVVGCDDMEGVCDERDQITEGVGARSVAMEEEDGWQ